MRDKLFRDRLGHTSDTRFRQRIVDLSSVAIHTTCARDVDDVPGLAVLDPKVRRCSPYNLEGRCRVQVDNGMPLLVRHLVNHTIPCVASIVDDDVNLAASKLSCFGDERLDVGVVEHVARYSQGTATRRVDFRGYRFRFLWKLVSRGAYIDL